MSVQDADDILPDPLLHRLETQKATTVTTLTLPPGKIPLPPGTHCASLCSVEHTSGKIKWLADRLHTLDTAKVDTHMGYMV